MQSLILKPEHACYIKIFKELESLNREEEKEKFG